jgi:hypothetical protein
MSITNFPNGVSSFGAPVIGGNIPATTGSYFWVDSGTGLSTNPGTYEAPMSTIDGAVNLCTASAHDVIIVAPGHSETIASATSLVMDTAGVQIIGLGTGSLRPTLTYSATASIINVTAADCTIENVILVSEIDNCVTAIALSAAGDGFTLRNVEVRDNASDEEFLIFMTIATTCPDVTIDGLAYHGLAGGMTDCIVAAGSADRFKLINSFFRVDASDKIVDFSAAASVGVIIANNLFINIDTGAGLAVALHNSCTGFVANNHTANLKDTVAPYTGTGMAYSQNYGSNALNASGIILPAVDT